VGKTEVLMRAAVAVASAGYKAVIVVPTRVWWINIWLPIVNASKAAVSYCLTILLCLGTYWWGLTAF